jgi:hypothetical protein
VGDRAELRPAGAGHGAGPLTGGFAALAAAASLIGLGNGLGSGTMMTLGADLAPPEAVGEFLGAWRLIGDGGSMGGPVLVGALADALGLPLATLAIAAVGAGAALTFAYGVPETLRPAGAPDARPPAAPPGAARGRRRAAASRAADVAAPRAPVAGEAGAAAVADQGVRRRRQRDVAGVGAGARRAPSAAARARHAGPWPAPGVVSAWAISCSRVSRTTSSG